MTGTNNETLTPIERVARALAAEDGFDWDDTPATGVTRAHYPKLSRAALAAIEEPSEAMIKAGWGAVTTEWTYKSTYDVWRAMHKAMMEEK